MPFDRVNQCKWNLWDEVILSLLISSWDEVILPLGCAFLPFCSICRCGLLERKIICEREEEMIEFHLCYAWIASVLVLAIEDKNWIFILIPKISNSCNIHRHDDSFRCFLRSWICRKGRSLVCKYIIAL